jgi:hypothetical protein
MKRFLRISEAPERYGPTTSSFRKWVREGTLGDAVKRCGRVVVLDTGVLDERLAKTGQLLVSKPVIRGKEGGGLPHNQNTGSESSPAPSDDDYRIPEPKSSRKKKAADSRSAAQREVCRANATTQR